MMAPAVFAKTIISGSLKIGYAGETAQATPTGAEISTLMALVGA